MGEFERACYQELHETIVGPLAEMLEAYKANDMEKFDETRKYFENLLTPEKPSDNLVLDPQENLTTGK
jgi:hypothetical protein